MLRLLTTIPFCYMLLATTALAGPITLPGQAPFIVPGANGAERHGRPAQQQLPDEAPQVTTARLEAALRQAGDYQQILALAPELLRRQPELETLRHLHAVALAASRQTDAAQAALDHATEDEAAGWHKVAAALLARNQGDHERAAHLVSATLDIDPRNPYAHNVAGTIAMAQGNLPLAAEHFEQAHELAPDSAPYLGNLGAVYLQQERLPEAGEALQRAVKLNPDDCSARTNHAALLLQLDQTAVARDELETCLQSRPDFRPAADALFDVLLQSGDQDAAQALLQRDDVSLSRPHQNAARLALQQGDGARAARHLRQAPATTEVELLHAFADAMQGRWQAAADRGRELAARKPGTDVVTLAARAFALAASAPLNDIDSATPEDPAVAAAMQFLAGLEAAMQSQSESLQAALRQADDFLPGITLSGLGEQQHAALSGSPAIAPLAAGYLFYLWQFNDAALAQLRQAAEAAPKLALPRILLALAAARAGATAEVTEALDQALQYAPRSYSANLLRAEQAIKQGDLDTALPLLVTASAVRAEPGALLRTGLVAETLGDDALARTHYEQLLAAQPNSFIANNQLAWFLAAREQELDHAMTLAMKADRLQPANASIQHTIGYIHFLRGDHQQAAQHVRKAFQVSGWEQPLIGLTLAKVELSAGNHAAARALLERLAENSDGNHAYATTARDLLDTL